jgi:plastocyanin
MRYLRSTLVFSFAALAALSACGGSSGGNNPGGGGTAIVVRDGGTGGVSGATVTMTSNGVSPVSVTVAVGQTVTFVNNDTRSHEMASNPHPQHGSCPSMEAGLGVIAAGQTKVTHNFANAGTCGYHDHQDDTNARFQGTIIIQ